MNGRTFWDFAADNADMMPLLLLVSLPVLGGLIALIYGLARLLVVFACGWPPADECCHHNEPEAGDDDDE